jgi:hypothetical protein
LGKREGGEEFKMGVFGSACAAKNTHFKFFNLDAIALAGLWNSILDR